MKAVVIGAGEVGSSIAANLASAHEVTVVDIDPDLVEQLTYSHDVLAIEGDGSDVEVLEDAGVGDADMLIASTDDDETNIVACGAAAIAGDPFTIARVKDPKYLRAWERARGAFDVDFMVCTDLLTAEAMVEVIGLPTAQDVDTFAEGLVQMTEFEIPADSPVAGQTVVEADRFDSLTFAAIMRGDEVVVPRGTTTIEPNDRVVVIGSVDSTRQFSAAIAPEREGPDDIIVMGGGEIGYQTARLLEERGFHPRLVEQDPERARWLAENLPKTTVLESDATDQEFLERENVGLADAVIATLENDQQNLLATLLAKRLGAGRAVTVVENSDFGQLFEAVGVDVAVSPREVAAEEITRFTRVSRAENVSIIEDDRAEVLEVEVDRDSVLLDRPIQESTADLPEGVVIGAVTRNGDLVTPRGDTVLRDGDHVVVFVATDVLDEVADEL